jgi:hypothetical protein
MTMHPSHVSFSRRWYVGERCDAGCLVLVLDERGARPLEARTADPLSSFAWGRPGGCARELSWSVLFNSTADRAVADDWCAQFTAEVVSRLPRAAFCLPRADVLGWLETDIPMLQQAKPVRSQALRASDHALVEAVARELFAPR